MTVLVEMLHLTFGIFDLFQFRLVQGSSSFVIYYHISIVL